MTHSHPAFTYRQRNYMAHLGRNDCTGNEQWLHFDGEYHRVVEWSSNCATARASARE